MPNPNPKKEYLIAQKTTWKHLPTKAVRIPEAFEAQVLELARSLDQRKSFQEVSEVSLFEILPKLSLSDLLKIQLELPMLIQQKREEMCDRRLEQAILFLAGRCDGANSWDGQGFNKFDTGFGHWLAERIESKQPILKSHAEAALKMVAKYSKQLERAGLSLPQWLDIEHQYPKGRKPVPEEELPEHRIELKNSGSKIAVYAPYDSSGKFQKLAKSIEGYKFNNDDKGWYFPVNKAEEILTTFGDGYEIDPNIEGAIALLKQQQAEEQAAKEREALEKSEEIIRLVQAADLDAPLSNGWYLRDYQKRGVEWLLAHRQGGIYRGGILADHMGLGKAQPLDSKLLTPFGWKNMGDIAHGDFVIGSDGRLTQVIGVYPQGFKQVYRVNFTDGTSVECCKEHLWAVRTPDQKRRSSDFRVLSLEALIDSGLSYRNGNLKYYIPMTAPVQFAPKQFHLHPYILGFLLGDGALSTNSVSWTKPIPEIAEIVSQLLPDDTEIHELDELRGHYSIVGKTHKSNSVLDELRKLELMGCLSSEKFIPDIYKFADVQSRISLLQGLLDSDGSVSDGVILEYGSTSKQLALDVMFLVESLGGTAKWSVRTPWYTYKNEVRQGQLFYRLNISLPSEIFPFKCRQKADKYVPRSKYQPSRGIKSVELVGEKQCQCIAVDAPNNLYLTEHCIVTHNTMTTLIAARAMQRTLDCPIFVIAPVSLLDNWRVEAERAEVRIEVFSWAKLPKPLDTSKYVLICDEAHYAQNLESQRTKKALELALHQNCLAAWMLTGTPIKNGRPINLYPLLCAVEHPLAADKWEYQKYYCAAHHKSIGKKTVWDNSGAAHLDELSRRTEDAILRRTKQECLTELPPKTRLYKPIELESKEATAYQQELKRLVEEYRQRAKEGKVSEDAEALVTLNYLRKVGSEFKVNAAIALAEELLEQGQQVVLFTEFLESAKAIHAACGGELLTGETPPQERQALVDRFQSGESKVFVGTIKAGGVGLTLTAASNVILVDRALTPGDCEQAEDRTHRLGQTNAVFATWLQLGEVDKAIDSLLVEKQQRIELVLKGKRKTLRGLNSPKDLAKELLAIL